MICEQDIKTGAIWYGRKNISNIIMILSYKKQQHDIHLYDIDVYHIINNRQFVLPHFDIELYKRFWCRVC